PEVKSWTSDARDKFDDLSDFLDECCIMEKRQENAGSYMTMVTAKDLNTAWNIWYAANRDRRHIPSGRALGTMLDKREIPKKLSNGTWRLGICLKPEWEAFVEDENEKSTRNTSRRFQGEF
ncbi:MAG: DNA primase, partial [Mailhella sp.]